MRKIRNEAVVFTLLALKKLKITQSLLFDSKLCLDFSE